MPYCHSKWTAYIYKNYNVFILSDKNTLNNSQRNKYLYKFEKRKEKKNPHNCLRWVWCESKIVLKRYDLFLKRYNPTSSLSDTDNMSVVQSFLNLITTSTGSMSPTTDNFWCVMFTETESTPKRSGYRTNQICQPEMWCDYISLCKSRKIQEINQIN